MSMSAAEFNLRIIEEFRANGGRVGGVFEGTPLLVLHHTGAGSGQERISPLGYLDEDGRYLVVASNGGAPDSPPRDHHLKAPPNARVGGRREASAVVPREAPGEERERLFRILA